MLTVRIQEKNHSESIMVLKLKDGPFAAKAGIEENSKTSIFIEMDFLIYGRIHI